MVIFTRAATAVGAVATAYSRLSTSSAVLLRQQLGRWHGAVARGADDKLPTVTCDGCGDGASALIVVTIHGPIINTAVLRGSQCRVSTVLYLVLPHRWLSRSRSLYTT